MAPRASDILSLTATLWLCALPAGAESRRAGILPVAGDPTLAARLDRELGRAVAERGVRTALGPAELSAELGAAPGVPAALEESGRLLDGSARAALHMKRGESVDLARQAIAKLETTLARHHARAALARAHGALARGLLLKPADEAGAREAFRAALAASSEYRGESLPPRAAQLLEEARREAKVIAPATDSLRQVAARAGLRAVLWIAVRPAESSRVELELTLYLATEGVLRAPLRRSGRAEDATALAAELCARALHAPAASAPASRRLVVDLTPRPTTRPMPAQPPAPARPAPGWYRRWWVWTIVGAVLAGAGVGLGLGLRSRSSTPPPPGLDFEFIY